MLLFDQHSHSLHSHERACKSNIAEMCLGAMKNGMSGNAITEHYDLGRKPREEVFGYLSASFEEFSRVKENLPDGYCLTFGMELGEGHMNTEDSGAALSLLPYDIVIGSLHNVAGHRDFSAIGKDWENKAELFDIYLDEQLVMAEWGRYDVLGHLTYPFRYYMLGSGCPKIKDYEDKLRALFTLMAQKGLGMEVNTSGLYRPEHGETMPALWELKLFRECGGEIVTTGSDAHEAANIGRGIREGAELLKSAGFAYQAHFVQRKPEFLPL